MVRSFESSPDKRQLFLDFAGLERRGNLDHTLLPMNRLSHCLSILVLLVEIVHAQDSFVVDTKAQWETWNFPLGTLNIEVNGSITPVRFDQPFNAAPDSPLFTHELRAGAQRGGVWKAGSNLAAASLIIDGDTSTYWQPNPADGADQWWIEIDLGRMVAVGEVRLHFPDEAGARPLRTFRVFGSDGKFQSIADDVFTFNLIGGTTKRNEETLVAFPVAFGEATKRVIRLGQSDGTTAANTAFAPLQYIRIVADAKSDQAALAEVEVMSFGQNIAGETMARGGLIDDQGKGRASAMIDGDVNTFWEELNWFEAGQFIAQWQWDLGAVYWINRVIFVAFQESTTFSRPRILRHRLLGSDGSLKPSGETDFDVLFDFPDPAGWHNPQPITYLLRPSRPLRHLGMVFGGSSSGAIAEIVAVPTGYVAEVEMRSDFIKIGERPKVFRTLEWDADLPPGTQIRTQTRSGSGLDEGNTYYHRKGHEVTEDEYNALKKRWKGDIVPYIRPSADWSDWSNDYLFSGQEFLSPNPRRYVQFRISLKSDTPTAAPTLRMLRILYTDSFLNGAFGEVTPKEARAGEAEDFTYRLQPDFADGDRGFNRFRLDTPSQTALGSLTIRIGATEIEPLAVELTPDSVVVALPQVVRRQAVQIDLRVNVFENPYAFNAFVGHTDDMGFWQQVDPMGRSATTVFLPEVPAALKLIDKIAISPAVLTPNGDGIGDRTEVRFAVLKTDAPVDVDIYSLDGRLVRSLAGGRGNDGFLVYTWSGDDALGRTVPPGIYVVRIDVKAQTDVEGVSRIVNVVY